MRFFLFFFLLTASLQSFADCTLAVNIQGAITAATKDYLQRAEKEAEKQNCQSIFVRLNTPGGELQATRWIVEKILASPRPYLCLITPSGGHAGSAGALILQACHVNGGVSATNLGAATPILGGGQTLPEDLRKKMINDTVSWSQGLAKIRGRNEKFAQEIVTEAKAVSSEEAFKFKALDIFAANEVDFLGKAKNFKVLVQEEKNKAVVVGDLREFPTDVRYKILDFVADPELAYLLFMASLALLYFEITHPGFIAPGVLGGLGLILSLIAFHKLEVQWGGLALILLGICFLIAEVFVPSFGILGVGGVISLIVGSFFLYDAELTGFTLPWALILMVSLFLGAIFMGLGYLAWKSVRRGKKNLDADLIGRSASVVSLENATRGQIEVLGEIWRIESSDSLALNDRILITGRDGLILKVKKEL
ncbi:MAG: nodulation protein NfeD [Pseudobdellovibrionaceae bacterium]